MLKISVVVPVYCTEKYIRECVDSILSQTYRDIELILVDDGSPDGCPVICDVYAQVDDRVVVIHQKNQGVAIARNAGLDRATGDLITFVDSDDYIDANMYAEMVKELDNSGCDMVICDCLKESPTGSQLYTHNIYGGRYDAQQMVEEYYSKLLILPEIEYPVTISNGGCLFRASLLRGADEEIRFEPGIRYSEDWLFGCRVIRRCNTFTYLKGAAFYHYRMNEASATHRFVPDKWYDYEKLYKCFCKYFSSDSAFNFGEQLDKVLLFLLYNAIGDLRRTVALSRRVKYRKVRTILLSPDVRNMFRRLHIRKLPIPPKLKLLTMFYKYRVGIWLFHVFIK